MIRGISLILKTSDATIDFIKHVSTYYLTDKKLFISVFDKVCADEVNDLGVAEDDFCTKQDLVQIFPFLKQINFLEMFVFSSEKHFCEINNYEQFKISKCEIAIFVTDSIYVDVYLKSSKAIEALTYFCEQLPLEVLDEITDLNDSRTEFHVL